MRTINQTLSVTWRQRAAAAIWEVVRAHPGASRKELRRLIRASYPFGPRKAYPYKAWLVEARALVGPGRVKRPAPVDRDALPLEEGE